MPNLQSQSAIFRRGGYQFTGYIGTIPETVVMSRAINQASFTYPVKSLTFDNPYSGAGSHTDVKVDQDIIVYDQNTDTIKGRLRVAFGGTTSSVIQVNEVARGVIDFADNDRFEVVEVYRIWDKLVAANATFDKDSRDTYGDEGSNPPPVSNPGGAWFGFVDRGQSYATVPFDGSTSWSVDPDSGSPTFDWTVVDGSIFEGSSSTAEMAATFPVGFRHVGLEVTDTNGKSTTKYAPVRVYDRSSDPPFAVQMESLSGNKVSGWRATFRLPNEDHSHIDNLPDGALVCYFEDMYHGGLNTSYGSNVDNRSHMQFVGFLVRDSIRMELGTNEVVFEAVSPLAILEQTPALPQLLVRNQTASKWSEVKTLTVGRALWYLAFWHSAFPFDFLQLDGSDFNYSRLAIENIDSIAGQLRDIASSINVQVTCDKLGRLLFVRDPNYLSLSDRNSLITTYALTVADMMELEFTREHRTSVKHVRGEGIIAGTTVAAQKGVFTNAPGNAPAPNATASETLSKQIITDQADLNTRSGHHFARVNSLFDGVIVPSDVRVKLPSAYYWLDPAYAEWVTLTLNGNTNKRGIGFSASERWIVEQVDISYDTDTGIKDITATISHETFGVSGTTYIPPKDNAPASFPSLDANFDFGQFGFTLPAPGGLRAGLQTVAKWHADNSYQYCTDFENPDPAWGVTVDLTALGSWPGGDLIGFEVDAYSPLYLGTGTTVNGWLTTDTHVMRITDIFGTPALTGIHAFGFTTPLRVMRFERGVQNWGIVASYLSGQGTYATYTTDGLNWTDVAVDTNHDTFPFGWQPGIWVSPHTAGLAYTSAFTTTGTGGGMVATLRRTLDYGATWATLASPATTPGRGLPHTIVVPYTSGASPIFYPNTADPAPFDPHMYRNNTDISPEVSAAPYGPAQRVRSISVADDNANVMMVCGADNFQGAATDYAVFLTRNALSAAPTYTTLFSENTATPSYLQVYAASQSAFYLMGMGGNIGFSSGVTIESKVGNSILTSEVVAICGG
jgi:hypothetical protein